jgi:hypothetical protein
VTTRVLCIRILDAKDRVIWQRDIPTAELPLNSDTSKALSLTATLEFRGQYPAIMVDVDAKMPCWSAEDFESQG